jgi:acyl-CoA thioesterase FadM
MLLGNRSFKTVTIYTLKFTTQKWVSLFNIKFTKEGPSAAFEKSKIGIFRNDDNTAAAQGHFVHVCCDRATQRPLAMPAGMRAALEKLNP